MTPPDSRAGLIVNAVSVLPERTSRWTVGRSDRRSAASRVEELLLNCDSCFHIFKGLTLDYVFFFLLLYFKGLGDLVIYLDCTAVYVTYPDIKKSPE